MDTNNHQPEGEHLTALARRAVKYYLRDGRIIQCEYSSNDPLLQQRAGCFVSIKTESGDLRGCIGTIEPTFPTLAEEIINNAIHAATSDPRFEPIIEAELPHLRFSVDILSEPEPTTFEDLNPAIYGVIVKDMVGERRGLLLPDIEGIESPSQQVQIAARKAGISPDTPLRLYRFQVIRFRESASDFTQ